MQIKSKSGRTFNLPSDDDDKKIREGIANDPDTQEVSTKEIKADNVLYHAGWLFVLGTIRSHLTSLSVASYPVSNPVGYYPFAHTMHHKEPAAHHDLHKHQSHAPD
uniref:Uncharacterized protein n=1 Tax=uncultured Thiotrichaceae bacterium TaxID=298394 RepID=A0A6S6U9G8_9GAMM|nr:MAG: Unknown protein [uncultured Thiotrichaceae bacterium]